MASILESDARFGAQGNSTFQTGLNTLDQLLDPNQNQVSVLPRLQQERDLLRADQSKKDAFTGDFAAAGLSGSRIQDALKESVTAGTEAGFAQAEGDEIQRQEQQDRAALQAFVQNVLEPNITGKQLNEEEVALRDQLKQLKKSKKLGNIMGALKIIGGIALTVATAGAAAPIGIGLVTSGAGDLS